MNDIVVSSSLRSVVIRVRGWLTDVRTNFNEGNQAGCATVEFAKVADVDALIADLVAERNKVFAYPVMRIEVGP